MNKKVEIQLLLTLVFAAFLAFTSFAQRKELTVSAGKMRGLAGGGQEFLNGFGFSYGSGIRGTADYAKKNLDGKYDIIGDVKVFMNNGTEVVSEKLYYDGVKFKFRENVKLINQGKTLYTEFLDFTPKDNSGYFYNGGKVVDSTSTLQSNKGYYYPDESVYVFVEKVEIKDKDYTLYSDTLRYELNTQKATVYSPTHVYGDSTYLYCESGWYNTSEEIAEFTKKAFVKSKHQTLKGDTLKYNQLTGLGSAYGNVEIEDTTQHLVIKGDRGFYIKKTEEAYVTQNALMLQISQADTLFLHADTLHSSYDTTKTYRIIRAFRHVRIFRNDLQASCDSLAYTLVDSVIHFFYHPIMWTGYNQLSAESMKLYTKNSKPDYLLMEKSAFIISQEDSLLFNQVKGSNMKGYFRKNELYRLDVNTAVQSIYFPRDGIFYIGVNRLEGEKMQVNLKKQRVHQMFMLSKAKGTLDPLLLIDDELRPKVWSDIFIWKEKTTEKQTVNNQPTTNKSK